MQDSTEKYWKENNTYHLRQSESEVGSVESNIRFFESILEKTLDLYSVKSVLELGAGTGQNIVAWNELLPDANLVSVELNEQAADMIPVGTVLIGSIFNCEEYLFEKSDLVLSKGVGIHVHPEKILEYYDILYRQSGKYILLCEYYNPVPLEVEYRGEAGKLWKRDFAGEMLDRFPGLELIDYGFQYHRDEFPQDDVTYFLMRKSV